MLNGSLDHMQMHKITPMCWTPLGTVFKKDNEQWQQLKKIATNFSLKYDVPIDIWYFASLWYSRPIKNSELNASSGCRDGIAGLVCSLVRKFRYSSSMNFGLLLILQKNCL
jgi:hypothetical protein